MVMFAYSSHCSYYAIHQYNAGHWNIKYCWEIVTMQHALQCDSSSCGVYVMKVWTCINTVYTQWNRKVFYLSVASTCTVLSWTEICLCLINCVHVISYTCNYYYSLESICFVTNQLLCCKFNCTQHHVGKKWQSHYYLIQVSVTYVAN